MANVIFKRGEHKNLPAINAAQDGVFYLTTDTNRLYVGQGTNLVELNKSITVIKNANQLPEYTTDDTKEVKGSQVAAGQFYYINAGADSVSGNILAVCSAVNSSTHKITWVQVNPDTNDNDNDNDDTKVTSLAVTSTTSDNAINYTITLEQETSHIGAEETHPDPITAILSINKNELTNLAGVSVDLYNSSKSNSAVTISTTGSGAAGSGFTITEGENIILSSTSGSGIALAAKDTTYKLTSATGSTSITLQGYNGATATGGAQNIVFSAGTAMSVSGATAGEIQYSHANVSNTPTTSSATASNGAGITVIDNITVNEQGHVTAYNTKTVSAVDTIITGGTISATSGNGNIIINLANNNSEDTTSISGTGILFNKMTVDGTEGTYYNQDSFGSFYSASKVDELIQGLNAMTYKGTVGTSGATTSTLPTTTTTASGIKVGDTYMASTSGTFAGQAADKGDLFIATGAEKNGFINGTVTWQLVPAGDDIDTTYTFGVLEDGTIQARPNPGTASATVAKIIGGTSITAVVSDGINITLNHLPSSVTAGSYGVSSATAPGYGGSFNVPYVTVDAQGHITSASNVAITLPDSVDTTYELSATTTGGEAVIQLTVTGSDDEYTSAPIIGDTTSINVTSVDSKIKVAHEQLLNSGTAGTTYGQSVSTSPAAGGTIKIPQIKVNAEGHVTDVSEQSITLPADEDTLFELKTAEVTATTSSNASTAIIAVKMGDTTTATSNDSTSLITFTSESLQFTKPASTTSIVKADIVWGSF